MNTNSVGNNNGFVSWKMMIELFDFVVNAMKTFGHIETFVVEKQVEPKVEKNCPFTKSSFASRGER